MARKKDNGRRMFRYPFMTYLTREQRVYVEAAAEREGVGASEWIRRRIAAELSRQAAREQVAAQGNNP